MRLLNWKRYQDDQRGRGEKGQHGDSLFPLYKGWRFYLLFLFCCCRRQALVGAGCIFPRSTTRLTIQQNTGINFTCTQSLTILSVKISNQCSKRTQYVYICPVKRNFKPIWERQSRTCKDHDTVSLTSHQNTCKFMIRMTYNLTFSRATSKTFMSCSFWSICNLQIKIPFIYSVTLKLTQLWHIIWLKVRYNAAYTSYMYIA